jgi:hypothetical protein
MRRETRGQGPSSTALRASFDSDLTDLSEVNGSSKYSKTTKRVKNTEAGEESDSASSSQFSAAAHDRCDVYEGEYEEMDSEEDTRSYSAYHGSDSEIPGSKLEKKQSLRVKKNLLVGHTTSKEKAVDSALQSDTVMLVESSCLPLVDLQSLCRKAILRRCRMSLQ